MSDSESERSTYETDSRVACKYGIKCYQKNPDHHKKYKHPPKKQNKGNDKHAIKKLKVGPSNKGLTEVVTKSELSDSDEYNIEDDSDANSDTESKDNSSTSRPTVSNDVSDSDESDVKIDTKSSDTVKEETKESSTNDKCEEEALAKSNPKEFIKQKFLVDMPEDFYQFWDFCKKMKPNNPTEALKDIGLTLVGPFDVVAGQFDDIERPDEAYLLHWRYYFDPPEFQTVLKGDDKSGYHIGYFRDSPDEPPVFLAENHSKREGVLQQMGGNIFTAVIMHLNYLKKSGDPFKKMHIGRILIAVQKEAEALKLDLSRRTEEMIIREKRIVSRTFNKIGLVVPYNRKSQIGYRSLSFTNKELSTLLTKLQYSSPEQKSKFLSELQPLFTNTSIATDECDFGTGIELGWNIISHGIDSLNSTAERFLATNYRLIDREAFAKIAEAHMKNRKKGCDLSIL